MLGALTFTIFVCVLVAFIFEYIRKKRRTERALMQAKIFGRKSTQPTARPTFEITPTQTPVQFAEPLAPLIDERAAHKQFFREASRSPFDVLARLRHGDIDGARHALQKIAYLVHADKKANPEQVRQFTELMCKFVDIDPLFWRSLKAIQPVIESSPGIIQTALYPHMVGDVELARYVLYFAHETGHIVRRKKGNSYEVFLPTQEMPAAPEKRSRKKAAGPSPVTALATKKSDVSSERNRQLEVFFTSKLGDGWQSGPFVYLSGWQTVEALWPMNEVFRANLAQISSLEYSEAFEHEADQALAMLAADGIWSTSAPSAGAWRVLFERHTQSITVAVANETAGNTNFMPLPQALQPFHHKVAAMLFLQWSMVLPLPPSKSAVLAWPENAQPSSLLQH